jgi:hypothetical protein
MINLHYIRAAILANTGRRISLERVKELLIEEKLVTPAQVSGAIFTGYGDYFGTDTAETQIEDNDTEMGLPDYFLSGS